MTELILFHHAQGLTDGVQAFAEELRAAGHRVTVPDFYDGATFPTLEEGVAHARQIGVDKIVELGVAVAEQLPGSIVYAGFSLGTRPAQRLAQTRPGALGALLYHGGVPSAELGGPWPAEVGLQIHSSEKDAWSELEELEGLVRETPDGELFLYPGSAHLFTDSSVEEYEPGSANLVLQRTLDFLGRWA